MRELAVEFELVTPAYAGGAERGETDGLRPPELKSLLRFWWRAAHGEKHGEDLFDEEAKIFGAAPYKKNGTQLGGQGVRVIPAAPYSAPRHDLPGTLANSPYEVYLGYGAVQWDGESRADPRKTRKGETGAQVLEVPRIHSGQSVQVKLRYPDAAHAALLKTLFLVSAFGGYGSRSRRGWGSLRVKASGLSDPHECADNPAKIAGALGHWLQQVVGARSACSANQPEHCAFSQHTRLFVGTVSRSADVALKQLYNAYSPYRKALGKDIHSAKTGPDYATRCSWLTTPPAPGAAIPIGSCDGLPHIAQFRSRKGTQLAVGVGDNLVGRRASSLFFKVLGNGSSFVPLVLWLPCLFLPHGIAPQMQITWPGKRKTAAVPLAGASHSGVTAFLDGTVAAGISGVAQDWDGLIKAGWQEVTW